MGDEQASRLEGLLLLSTARVPIVLLQRVEEVIPAVRESLNWMDILKSEPGPCTGACQISSDDGNEVGGKRGAYVSDIKMEEDPWPATTTGIETEPASYMDILKSEPGSSIGTCQMSSDDGNQFVGIKVEDVTDVKEEEDPGPATSTGIKSEPANCLDVLRGEHESCTETCSASSGDGKQFVFVNVDDDTIMKWQEDPEPTTSTAINNDPLNCVNLLRSDYGSCSETCLISLDNENWGVDIKGEEVTGTEEELNSQPEAFQTTKAEPERTLNGQLCTCSRNCATSCNACKKEFVQKGHLKKHEQIHTEKGPFPCVVCRKSFVQRCDLLKHKQIH